MLSILPESVWNFNENVLHTNTKYKTPHRSVDDDDDDVVSQSCNIPLQQKKKFEKFQDTFFPRAYE